MLMVKIWKSHF